MIRLASGVWVGAYLRRLQAAGIFAHVARKGDETAGAVWVKVALMNGRARLFARRYDWDGNAVWEEVRPEEPEPDTDAAIARERDRDRDLWVVEVEDVRGRHLLDGEGAAF